MKIRSMAHLPRKYSYWYQFLQYLVWSMVLVTLFLSWYFIIWAIAPRGSL